MAKKRKIKVKKLRWVPLKGTVMVTSIIGLLFTLFYWNTLGIDWGSAFFVVFVAMFIASLVSLEKASTTEY